MQQCIQVQQILYFRGVRVIVNASKLNKIFPIIEEIKLKQFLQRRSLVNPLSDIPNNPINNKDKIERTRENIKTVVIPVIVPI